MANKADLFDLIQEGHREILSFASMLGPVERAQSGTPEHWARRDVLVHMSAWKLRLAQNLKAERLGEAVQADDGNFDSQNEAIFLAYCSRPWEDILALINQSQSELLAELELVSEDDLNDPARYLWLGGRPLWRNVVGNAYLHPAAHLRPEYIAAGDLQGMERISLSEYKLAGKLDDSPEWQGMLRYNLGCSYALAGDKFHALEYLEAGFNQNPGLAEFAPQDSDLISLYADPDFLALLDRFKN
jgi:hypothetical protein